jgi:hypothetical protein
VNPFLFGNPAAFGQQTAANKVIVASAAGNGMGRAPSRRKRKSSRKTAARRAPRSAAKRRAPKRRARLVKGSAAAKAYMAKIRRKRR